MPDIVSKLLCAAIWSRCAVWFESEQMPFPRKGSISFATYFAANFGCDRFRIMPDIISKLLRATIWSRCAAVWFESEQTPFPWTGRRLRSAALHRIRFGTCGFVPMSYFYSGTRANEWSQDWAKQWAWLWQATTSGESGRFHGNSWPFPKKKKPVVTAQYLQSIKTFLTVELIQYSKSGSTFSSSESVAASSDCSRLGNKLCLCLPVWPAQAVPERGFKSLAIDIAVKSFDCLLE